jgi:hypothetical protein
MSQRKPQRSAMFWMVHIEAIAENALDPQAVERFTDELQSCSGAVRSSSATWNATITVEAPEPVEAATIGDVAIRGAAIAPKLPRLAIHSARSTNL